MNKLNHDVYDYSSYVKGSIYGNEFLTSHTDFAIPDYGNSPLQFVNQLGFSDEEWNRAGKVTVLRASVMTPYMNKEEHFEEYAEKSKQLFKKNWKKSTQTNYWQAKQNKQGNHVRKQLEY